MRYILYSYPDCASHVVRMVLEELGATYRDEIVPMHEGAHRSDEFLRLNPRGIVPVLADENSGAVLSETGAILNYLADQNGQLAPEPKEAQSRAVFLQTLFFLSNTLHSDAQLQYYTERYVGHDLAEIVRPKIHDRMRSHLKMLDAAIGQNGGPWLLGSGLSVCDFYLAGCVRWALIAPRHAPLEAEVLTQLPFLTKLLEQLEARDSVHRAFDAEDTPRSAYFRAPIRSNWTRDASGLPWRVL
ncbi:glutathione S-transferase family protein [Roseibium sp. HPY-6]|uniref:glutathione S-transferase family protein n=1 Tax=Roseibium sp. HPY-6 TaxID=3229852 RepID=UPI00338DD1F5